MSNNLYFSLIYFYFFIFLFLFSCGNIICQEEDLFNSGCDYYEKYNFLTNNEYCFNNIIIFKDKNYQVNHFAKKKNGDFIVEFTEHTEYDELSSSRLFYGLTNDGQYFFPNESSYTYESNIDIDEETYYENIFYNLDGIYDSKNLFVTIWNAANRGNEYLFSINSYNSMVELHDLKNKDNKYQIWSFNKFFKLDEKDYFWPYNYEIYELPKESAYIIAFIPTNDIIEEMLNVSFIKKFRFKTFDDNAYEELNSVKFENYLNHIILNVFLMDDFLVVLSYAKIEDSTDGEGGRRILQGQGNPILPDDCNINLDYYKFLLKFYGKSLKSPFDDMEIYNSFLNYWCPREEIFIKSRYLNNKIVAFIYYTSSYNCFTIELFKLKSQIGTNEISPLNSQILIFY